MSIKSYLNKISTDEPFLIVQSVSKRTPWDEPEKILSDKDIKGRYSSGPSYLEIYKQYIRSIGNYNQVHRLFYYAFGKV